MTDSIVVEGYTLPFIFENDRSRFYYVWTGTKGLFAGMPK